MFKDDKLQLIKLLVERGINVNMVDKSGRSALLLAVQTLCEDQIKGDRKVMMYRSSKEIVLELLQSGADVNLQDNSGNTALTTFCLTGKESSVLILT